ncbi:HD domain-containing protein [Lactococcus termiticola]|uniref:Metal-dependent phosphohydrolase n=1 Tax=Lactococcus termiticola TaxID=2169526 RepID=A0A2R5HFM4_9LACT|nr:HD domain-containing protein [Lactococcus termiticola]GBG96869.1 metal-dependent phosphohydrolase [Lactococcus termiticola]
MSKLDKIADYARSIHEKNQDGHGFDHIQRVVALARKILLEEPNADSELVLTSAYLHDSYDEKITADVDQQKEEVAGFLKGLEIDSEPVFNIIDQMSFSANIDGKKALSLEGQIVQDADRLDAMGAWGIARTLEYGWAHERVLYDPEQKPVDYLDKASYHKAKGTTINHFYEKLFLLKDLLNRPASKKMAERRHQIMLDFVAAIEQEYQESL